MARQVTPTPDVSAVFKSGQYRRWYTNSGALLGIVRLIAPITRIQSRNDATVGDWYVQLVETGVKMIVSPYRLGEQAAAMEVLAWASKT